jgi:FMN phosphatase YigB (HAD superfamily)
VGKPDRQIFEAALRKCELEHLQQNPQRIVYIGNETELDVKGGKSMGWKTVLMRTTELSSNGLADWEFDTLDQIISIL